MRIGFLTACLPAIPLEELVKWASKNGFSALEVGCLPEVSFKTQGSNLDVSHLEMTEISRIKELFKKHLMTISSLAYYDNLLDPDIAARKKKHDHLKKVIDTAANLEANLVGTFVGRDPNLNLEDNFKLYQEVFTHLLDYASIRGVRLMIENCPMVSWQKEGLPGNIAYSPENWERMFLLISSPKLGLNLDPSHLYWLGTDYLQAIRDFSGRIFHTHAKDTEILMDRMSYQTILGKEWWRYRIPGWGAIDWCEFISVLSETGYDGVLSIEHEDPVWHGDENRIKKGLILGYRHLAQFII